MRRPSVLRTVLLSGVVGILSYAGAAPSARAQALNQLIAPGDPFTVKGFQPSKSPSLCQLVACPKPPLGGETVNADERGTFLFLPFSEMQLKHPTGSLFFRAGDWKLRLEGPKQMPFPLDLVEFREEHVEHGSGVIGDQPGEGVGLYFPWPAVVWEKAQALSLDMVISNLTEGTSRKRSYLVGGIGRGALPPIRFCTRREGTGSGFALWTHRVLTEQEYHGYPDLVAGDVDADGQVDLLARQYVSRVGEELVALRSRGRGSFSVTRDVETCGLCIDGFAGGDLDGDGDMDLALGRLLELPSGGGPEGDMALLLNGGGGSFAAPSFFTLPPGFVPSEIDLVDLNGDGNADVAASNVYSHTHGREIAVLLGTGRGAFLPGRVTSLDQPTASGFIGPVAAADLDRDGDLDLAGLNAHEAASSVAILLGDGRGGLAPSRFADSGISYPGITNPGDDMVAEDLDGDGDHDLAVGLGTQVSVLLNRGDGSFSTPGIYAARPWVNHLAAADLDGDGDPDLAASCRVDDVVVTLQNGGRGRFLDGGTYPVGESPMGFAAGDLDGDGDVDLGTADGRSYTVSVLENLTLGAIRAGDPRLDVIVQAAPSGPGGISPALYDGETSEMTVWVRPGSVGTATFYVALVSALPSGGPGIGAWSLLASIDDDLEVVSVTTSGTAAEAADFAFGTHGELVDMEGTPVAQGFAANAYFEAATLPAAGTATVLKVTVRTRNTLAVGQEVRGRIDWHDGRAELYPDDTLTGIPFDNWAHIQSRRHFFCECRGLRLVFRSPGIFNLPLDPGEAIDATDILPDGLLPICEIFECPKPPLGGEPVPSADMEMGLSLFLPFPPAMVVDSWRVRLFRPEDWALEIVDPENPKSPPLTLTEFREEHLEWGSGMLGDQPGEGVNLFFPVDSKTWSAIAKQTVTVRIMNLTDGGLNAGTYWIGRLGRGALPAFRLCSTTEGDRRLDVIIQAAPRGDGGLSPIPGDGEVSEIVTPVTPGAFGEATFYVALASSLPADMPGIQGWQLTASLSGDVELTSVTTDATAAAAAGHRRATTGKLVNAVTGTSGGPGLATLVSLSLVDPATLPPVGTATVLRVTVRTAAPVPPGGEARGRLEWIDGFELVHAVGRTRFVYNAASVFNRTHFFCECRGVDLIFRPGPSHLFRFLRGDTNGDGKHDLSDSIRILERLFLDREKSICLGAADANSDQKIDLADGVFLLQFFFLGGKPPAEPFRQCGTDPGTQNFSCEISACE